MVEYRKEFIAPREKCLAGGERRARMSGRSFPFDPSHCELCPRRCGADRSRRAGFCGAPDGAVVSKTMLHPFEEPCVSGADAKRGAGTVFFCGCVLRCVYCQNAAISRRADGEIMTERSLARAFLDLQERGAYTLDLVSPTPYAPYIAAALDLLGGRLKIPVVWNTGGYERPETVRALSSYVDVWLTDVKYADGDLAARYGAPSDYPRASLEALRAMVDAAGKPRYADLADGSRIMTGGVIVRHLVLPSHRRDSEAVLRAIAETVGSSDVVLSLMSQYTPEFAPPSFPELSRRVTTFEYEYAADVARSLGFAGYGQERESAVSAYTPDFARGK